MELNSAVFSNNFYGNTRKHHHGLATGTHPDPAIRMKYIYLNVISLLKNSHVIAYHQNGKTLDDYKKIMEKYFGYGDASVMPIFL